MAHVVPVALRVIVVVQVKKVMPYTKSFSLYQGGKKTNPDELTKVSDSGERTQPTQIQVEDEVYELTSLYAAIDLGSNSFHMLVVREVAEASRRSRV